MSKLRATQNPRVLPVLRTCTISCVVFLCIICINFTVQIVKSICAQTYNCINRLLFQQLSCVCVCGQKAVCPLNIKSMSLLTSMYSIDIYPTKNKTKQKTYHNQWTHVCTFAKTLKINSTLD